MRKPSSPTPIRGLAALTLGAALAGCSLAPTYERPATPVPATWSEGAPAASTGAAPTAPTPLPWRNVLADPRLQSLIETALAENRDLRIATARIEEARGLHGVSRADRMPNLELGASRTATRTPADLTTPGYPRTTQSYGLSANLLSFEIDLWGRMRNLSDSALASYLATEEAQRAVRLSLIADVASAWFSLLELDERVALTRATLDNRAESRRIVARRAEVGLASALDLAQADAVLETARADLASLERSRAAAKNALDVLVGKPTAIAANARLEGQTAGFAALPAAIDSSVLLRRPDILAAEQKLLAANANIGAARAAFFPRITLLGGGGVGAREIGNLFDAGNGAWSFIPQIRLPIFDGFRNQANLDVAVARKDIAVAEYERAIQQAFREVADALSARDRYAAQEAALAAGLQAQSERLRLARKRYDAGVSAYLEVLDAERDRYATEQSLVQTRRARLTNDVQLYKALGGDATAAGA